MRTPRRTTLALETLEDRLLLAGTIRGVSFDDLNGNGVRDAGEPPAVGRVVFLDTDRDGIRDPGERATTTAADGSFTFTNLAPGNYLVAHLLPSGWRATAPVLTAALNTVPDGGRLVGMDRFRADPRFTNIDGRGFSVVVIDSGIASHPFFPAGTVTTQHDFVNNDPIADDGNGHGTHMSSVIASRDRTYPGVAPGVNLIALKVLDADGGGDFRNIERALQWTLDHRVQHNIIAVNLAFGDAGNYSGHRLLHGISDELQRLAAAGVTVVAAAGNGHQPGIEPGLMYPAIDPTVIPVGAVWDTSSGGPWNWGNGARDIRTGPDRIVSFSQRLPGVQQVFAPGARLSGADAQGGSVEMSGTSGAAAFITGVVALAQQLARDRLGRILGPAEMKQLLQQTGVVIRDGDDENDNVVNTNASFRRVDVMALAEAILARGSVSPGMNAASRFVSLSGDRTVANVLLGQFREGRAEGIVFDDRDGDGRQDQDEPPISNRLVFADQNGDGVHDAGERSARTDANGRFVLVGLGPGTIQIRQQLPASQRQTTPVQTLTITGGLARTGLALGSTTDRVNAAPTLSGNGRSSSILEDSTNPAGKTVRELLGNTFFDRDPGTSPGLALSEAGGGWGRWQYSLNDGRTWQDVGTVSMSRALLLRAQDRIRIVPNANANGSVTIRYHAWDQSTDQAGGRANLTGGRGGTTAFSTTSAMARVEVHPINDPPVLSGPGKLTSILADTTNPRGDRVANVLADTVTDVDNSLPLGMAIFATSGNGTWQFSRDGGVSWRAIGAIPAGTGRLLSPHDRVRFVPTRGWTGTATLRYRAWDMTVGSAGELLDLGRWNKMGATTVSEQTATASLLVEPAQARAANVITMSEQLRGAGLIAAVTATEGNGIWQYSLDGRTWRDVVHVRGNRALVLTREAQVRFVPRAGWNGRARLTYRVVRMGYRTGTLIDISRMAAETRTLDWVE